MKDGAIIQFGGDSVPFSCYDKTLWPKAIQRTMGLFQCTGYHPTLKELGAGNEVPHRPWVYSTCWLSYQYMLS